MELKTARRGKNSGGQFWGCPNWRTTCKGVTLPYEDSSKSSSSQGVSNHSKSESLTLPTLLSARPRRRAEQVRFYDCLALPKSLLDYFHETSQGRYFLNLNRKWRLDFPIFENSDDKKRNLGLALYKILLRGSVIFNSELTENSLKAYFFGEGNIDWKHLAFSNKSLDPTSSQRKASFSSLDSEEERIFYEELWPRYFGASAYKFIIPQVNFQSLVGSDSELDGYDERVDFVVTGSNGKRLVIEVDGDQHNDPDAVRIDEARDSLLKQNGFDIIRIAASTVREQLNFPDLVICTKSGKSLLEFIKPLEVLDVQSVSNEDSESLFLASCQTVNQIKISILEALVCGVSQNALYWDFASTIYSKDQAVLIIKLVTDEMDSLFRNISSLHGETYDCFPLEIFLYEEGVTNPSLEDLVFSYDPMLSVPCSLMAIEEICWFKSLQLQECAFGFINKLNPTKKNVDFFLNYIFRFKSLRDGQFEGVARSLLGNDSIILLPTGAGKSIIYQLSTILSPGLGIVISPLRALMDDQIENLKSFGLNRATAIHSGIAIADREQVLNLYGTGHYQLVYVSPERFQISSFRESLRTLTAHSSVSVIAIDEAHCVSEWGHDFRPAYLNIGRSSRQLCTSRNRVPPIVALTGTASHAVLRDVQRELQIHDFEAIITPKSFDRKELSYYVIETPTSEKFQSVKGILFNHLPNKFSVTSETLFRTRGANTFSGIIFCPHTNGQFGVTELSQNLNKEFSSNVSAFYASAAPRGFNKEIWEREKTQIANNFKKNQIPLLVSTKAFGMGIDKGNIRYTIHSGLPASIEQFYQEVGRAGRNGSSSIGTLIFSNEERERTRHLLSPSTSPEEVAEIIENVKWDNRDDIINALWFHVQSFTGIQNELSQFKEFVNLLNEPRWKADRCLVSSPSDWGNTKLIEKILLRLLTLGIVRDYTVESFKSGTYSITFNDASAEEIEINFQNYVSAYSMGRVIGELDKLRSVKTDDINDFIIHAYKTLINFIYETIEKGRRRGLYEIVILAEEANRSVDCDSFVRNRILGYLETSFSDEINLVKDEEKGFKSLKKVVEGEEDPQRLGEFIGGIRSPKDANEIRGQAARALESIPDHPGLLLLRAISESICSDCEPKVVSENINASFNASKVYDIQENTFFEATIWALSFMHSKCNSINYSEIAKEVILKIANESFERMIIQTDELPFDMKLEPFSAVFTRYASQTNSLLGKN